MKDGPGQNKQKAKQYPSTRKSPVINSDSSQFTDEIRPMLTQTDPVWGCKWDSKVIIG